jgi:anti-anti-sigma factor
MKKVFFTPIMLQGEYDLARQQELRTQLSAAESLDHALLDLRKVTFLDTAALTEFVRLKRRMPSPAIVRIIGAIPQIRKTFHITGLDTLFEMHESFSSATVPFSPDRSYSEHVK